MCPSQNGNPAVASVENDKTPYPHTGTKDHKEYFWDVIKFQVGGVRFQLPLYPFREQSEAFTTQYGLSDSTFENGFSSSLITLDVDLEDFERFLKAFLPWSPAAWKAGGSLAASPKISLARRTLCRRR
ncbi:hypothetical protein BKA70DRAFT_1320208 [Coprinopsis sp. MPI-PUGE-AT-0042]|nr:hypothetical protein BKA70DRAFT_1320208 [Coprinopsis sp. MPI-PUGE-AT-0042]